MTPLPSFTCPLPFSFPADPMSPQAKELGFLGFPAFIWLTSSLCEDRAFLFSEIEVSLSDVFASPTVFLEASSEMVV